MNKLKPEDVMRALEHCATEAKCDGCVLENTPHCECELMEAALALLREKDAEIERLQGALKAEEQHNELTMECAKKALANARADAITEFAERLGKWFSHDPAFLGVEKRLVIDVVDQIAKDLKEDLK